MKRRTFTQWVGLGAIASSLPVAIAACQSTPQSTLSQSTDPEAGSAASSSSSTAPVTVDSTPRDDGFAAIGTVATLDKQGFISDKGFFLGSVLVIRDPSNANAVLAVDSLCTHQGCSVAWESDAGTFDCPCHGSKFNVDGTVAAGPATAPLGKFDAILDGELVLVKAAS